MATTWATILRAVAALLMARVHCRASFDVASTMILMFARALATAAPSAMRSSISSDSDGLLALSRTMRWSSRSSLSSGAWILIQSISMDVVLTIVILPVACFFFFLFSSSVWAAPVVAEFA